jgi:RimJ/RimL family protein N-acetyltransferase
VLEENINARKFYEKLGFEHDGTIKEISIGKPLNEYRYIKE